MSEHLSQSSIDLFIVGGLPAHEQAEFDAHTIACERCASRLQRAAALEEPLRIVAQSNLRVLKPRVFAELAAAAAALAVVAWGVHTHAPKSGLPQLEFVAGATALDEPMDAPHRGLDERMEISAQAPDERP